MSNLCAWGSHDSTAAAFSSCFHCDGHGLLTLCIVWVRFFCIMCEWSVSCHRNRKRSRRAEFLPFSKVAAQTVALYRATAKPVHSSNTVVQHQYNGSRASSSCLVCQQSRCMCGCLVHSRRSNPRQHFHVQCNKQHTHGRAAYQLYEAYSSNSYTSLGRLYSPWSTCDATGLSSQPYPKGEPCIMVWYGCGMVMGWYGMAWYGRGNGVVYKALRSAGGIRHPPRSFKTKKT